MKEKKNGKKVVFLVVGLCAIPVVAVYFIYQWMLTL